jgi:hypothetical protein
MFGINILSVIHLFVVQLMQQHLECNDEHKLHADVVSGNDVVNDVTYENSVDTDRHVKHTKYKTGHWCKV